MKTGIKKEWAIAYRLGYEPNDVKTIFTNWKASEIYKDGIFYLDFDESDDDFQQMVEFSLACIVGGGKIVRFSVEEKPEKFKTRNPKKDKLVKNSITAEKKSETEKIVKEKVEKEEHEHIRKENERLQKEIEEKRKLMQSEKAKPVSKALVLKAEDIMKERQNKLEENVKNNNFIFS